MRKLKSGPVSNRHIVIVAVVSLVVLTTLGGIRSQAGTRSDPLRSQPQNKSLRGQYAPGQILVKFKPGVSTLKKNGVKAAVGVERLLDKFGPKGKKDTYLYKLKPGRAVAASIDKIKADPNVLFVEANRLYSTSLLPNDTYFGNQWGLNNTGQVIGGAAGTPDADVDAPEAWAMLTGASATATIAVIDTGIDPSHPDLAPKLWLNASETPGNNVDDDGNGYVDDVYGHNWADISQYANEGTVFFGSASPDAHYSELAQAFVGNGGRISSIGLEAIKFGVPAAGVRASIRSTRDGADLAWVDLPASSFSTSWGWVEAAFSSPVKVDDGVSYYLVLHTDTNDYDNSYALSFTDYTTNGNNNFFPDGSFWTKEAGWVEQPLNDFTFAVTFDGLGGRGGAPRDGNGHGTHVAGIAAGAVNDGGGIAGLSGYPAGAAQIMPLRVLDTEGTGWTSDIAAAIYYAADNGADVINMSLGGGGPDASFQAAIDYAYSKGVVTVAAAGNDGNTTMNYPAGYDNVIGVAATTYKDLRASYSNYNSSVDVAAPGSNIFSSTPTYPHFDSIVYGADEGYDYLSGTSMATPFVAGLAALLRAAEPGSTPTRVEQFIKDGAADLGAAGRDNYFGYGRINAADSLARLTPQTTLSAAPATPNGENGWYRIAPTLTLAVEPVLAASRYSWDSTASPTTYTAPFQPPEGAHTLYYSSVNGAGFEEALQARAFKVDTGKPIAPALSSLTPTGTPSATQTVAVDLTGATDAISGLAGFRGLWDKSLSTQPGTDTTNMPPTALSTDSAPLADGDWYFRLRTKDNAGNWTSAAHIGPFVIEAQPPVTTLEATPAVDGDNGWYMNSPVITFTTNESATTYYSWDDSSSVATTFTTPLTIPSDGEHDLYYRSVDLASNAETPLVEHFKLDRARPTDPTVSSPSHTAGAWSNDNTIDVNLSGAADGAGSGVNGYSYLFNNTAGAVPDAVKDSGAVTSVNSGALANGTWYLHLRTKDNAGNWTSTRHIGPFYIDKTAPTAAVTSTKISTNESKTKLFNVSWSGADSGGSGSASYDVQVKVGKTGSWYNWRLGTAATSAVFTGRPGKTYYFHARATDGAGNTGAYSAESKTIVPHDQNGRVKSRIGFVSTVSRASSNHYLGTVRFSKKRGERVTYRFVGDYFAFITYKGKGHGRADVYVDGKFKKRIDTGSIKARFRRVVFSASWPSVGNHTVRIVNRATPGRPRLDLDAVAVGK